MMQGHRVQLGWGRPDWATLGAEWRCLEEAADGSFFQSWTWVGCRVRERFPDPWLLRATTAGAVVGLALFNRSGPPLARTLHLHETGCGPEDSVFIEHNGPLLAPGHADLLAPMLAAGLAHGRLILSGVDAATLAAARAIALADGGRCRVVASRPAPFARLDGGEAAWLARLGASTRYQLRRSRRRYEADGRLEVRAAADMTEALAFLTDLVRLHQARWTARGKPGAFAAPSVMAFHRALIAEALPRREVELLRIAVVAPSGPRVLGYLYNFRWRDRVYAYQGGFDYAAAAAHQTPGLTCHHAAIGAACTTGAAIYDFLAGEARYKSGLGDSESRLHWLALARTGTAHAFLECARSYLSQGRRLSLARHRLHQDDAAHPSHQRNKPI